MHKLKEKLWDEIRQMEEEFLKRPSERLNYNLNIALKNIKYLNELEDDEDETRMTSDNKKRNMWS